MGIVTTATHPIFSFHCILLFLFLPSFLEIPWSSIIMVPTEYLQEYKMLLDLIISISMPGIQTKQEMITSQLLSVLLHQFLTNLES